MSSGIELINTLKERGLVYTWDDVVNLNINTPFVYSFTTAENNVVLRHIGIESPSMKAMEHATIEIYSGGDVSGGTEIFVSNFNDADPDSGNDSAAFEIGSVFRDRTIDVAGTKFFGRNMVGDKFVVYEKLHTFFFLKKETKYYIVLTNIMSNNDLLKIEVLALVNT